MELLLVTYCSFACGMYNNNLLHWLLDISQAVVKAENEDKQDAIMLADAEDQEDPDDEQLDMQQDDDEPEDNDVEELNYAATDGNDDEKNVVQQQDDDDDEDALSKTLYSMSSLLHVHYSCLIFSIISASGRKCFKKKICRWIRRRSSTQNMCKHVSKNF